MLIEDFNRRFEKVHSEILSASLGSVDEIAKLMLALSINGLVAVPTDFNDEMPAICKLLLIPSTRTEDKVWHYIIPSEEYKP